MFFLDVVLWFGWFYWGKLELKMFWISGGWGYLVIIFFIRVKMNYLNICFLSVYMKKLFGNLFWVGWKCIDRFLVGMKNGKLGMGGKSCKG